MSDLAPELKQAFLTSLYDAVVDGTATIDLASGVQITDTPITTLLEAIKAFQRLGFNALKAGKLSLGAAGMSHEVRWAPPADWRSFSQEQVYMLAQELRTGYEIAFANLGGSPTDQQILAEMLTADATQEVHSLQRDFTMIRCY